MSSVYADLVAEGDDPDAPRRVQTELRGDRATIMLSDPDHLNALSAPGRGPAERSGRRDGDLALDPQ